MLTLILLFLLHSVAGKKLANGAIHTSYHWHLQQPIYWPDVDPQNKLTYQKAYETYVLKSSQEDMADIFGKDDRVAIYQSRAKDSINSNSAPDMGAQVSYSGCLMENINSLADHGLFGYAKNYNQTYAQVRQQRKTSGGFPKLDFVWFTYHHSIAPLMDKNALEKSLSIFKVIYAKTWGANPPISNGFFPAEMSFSERIIPVLNKLGIKWSIVANNHLSRACQNYAFSPSGDNNDPPNRADQVNPPQSNWHRQSISRGVTPNNAFPFSFQAHKAKYVDPTTGEEIKLTVVPAAQAMSWQDGYECYSTSDFDQMASSNDPSHPMIMLFAHDGDNDFGGGYSYYLQCVPNFVNEATSKGYVPTTIEQFLADFPVDDNDVVHVEDGAWVNPDPDFGSPYFLQWNWPLLAQNGSISIPNGWSDRERNWAVITAAENRVETAEQMSGGVRVEQIQEPQADATAAEEAWHFFLPSMTSGYMYYGNVQDMPAKPNVACNVATSFADRVVNSSSVPDKTAPTIWAPQRYPYNAGAYGAGVLYQWKYTKVPADFYVWTFVYDVSGVKSVTFNYRRDSDGLNPIDDNANEVYEPARHGLSGVGDWVTAPMNYRQMPKGNFYNQSIDLGPTPNYIADEYWIYVTGLRNVLIDYYISATDGAGNVKNSDIYHMWVGS